MKLIWIEFEVWPYLFIFYLHFILIQNNTKKLLLTCWLVIFISFLFGVDWCWFDSHLINWIWYLSPFPPLFIFIPFFPSMANDLSFYGWSWQMRGLTFFDPNQTQLDPWSSELFCVQDRLLLGQANNLKSIQGLSPFVLAWQVYGAWLTSHDL